MTHGVFIDILDEKSEKVDTFRLGAIEELSYYEYNVMNFVEVMNLTVPVVNAGVASLVAATLDNVKKWTVAAANDEGNRSYHNAKYAFALPEAGDPIDIEEGTKAKAFLQGHSGKRWSVRSR